MKTATPIRESVDRLRQVLDEFLGFGKKKPEAPPSKRAVSTPVGQECPKGHHRMYRGGEPIPYCRKSETV